MASLGQPPAVVGAAASPENQPSSTKIEAFGVKVEIPLPKWAVACLAALLIVGLAAAGLFFSATKLTDKVMIPTSQMEVYEETNYHLTEPSALKEIKEETFEATTVTLSYFKSDGCVQIVKWNAALGQGEGLWMFGPHPHSVGHRHNTALTQPAPPMPESRLLEPVSYQQKLEETVQLEPVQVHQCWNPHPGAFTVTNQPMDQCVIKVWRTFYDGCVHYQFFNACAGTWDVYPNGAPRVFWTYCIH